MRWENLQPWKAVLESIKLRTLATPKSLKSLDFGDGLIVESFALAFDDKDHPIVIHLNTKDSLTQSEMHRLLRRAYGKNLALAPCIFSTGTSDNLGIFIVTDTDEEAFQVLNLSDPKSPSQELVAEFQAAALKASLSEKIQALHKALDYEVLSKRFFESASECKELFENDIFESTRLTRNDANSQAVSHYAIIVMARLIFLHFLEKKRLLNHDEFFIRNQIVGNPELDLEPSSELWNKLFKHLFEILNNPSQKKRPASFAKSSFPYLNGGLFASYEEVEGLTSFEKLKISDHSLKKFHSECLYKYRLATKEEQDKSATRGVLDPELLGTIFEKFMKDDVSASTGSVYTPKDLVLFIVRNAFYRYFLNADLPQKTAFDLVHKKEVSQQFADLADRAHASLKVIDPCCGSGAFLLTALQELFEIKRAIRRGQGKERWHNGDKRRAYEEILGNNLFGIDINPEAIILCHLRLWLPIIDLIDGVSDYSKISPLPNLGLNYRCGNSLLNPKSDWESPSWSKTHASSLSELRVKYFKAESKDLEKIILKFDEIADQGDGFIRLSRNFLDIRFGNSNGFDVAIGNPPYLGLKKTKKISYLRDWESLTGGTIEDMYILFTKETYRILRDRGCLAFVTSNTYFTDSGKEQFREILLGNSNEFPTNALQLVELSPKTFKEVEVNPAVFLFNRRPLKSEKTEIIRILHAHSHSSIRSINRHITDLNDEPEKYSRRDGEGLKHVFSDMPIATIKKIPRSNFFIPNRERLDFMRNFGTDWRKIFDQVWPLIETSKKTAANSDKLEAIRRSIAPFDITILGLLTEGGVGLQTGSNATHLAFLSETAEARILIEKIQKARRDIASGNRAGQKITEGQKHIQAVVKSLRRNGHPYAEAEFDFVHKVIQENQIFDVSSLTAGELETIRHNGISKFMAKSKGVKYPCYVPYYKGQDSEFNRWSQDLTTYIDWSEENVNWIRNHHSADFLGSPRWQGANFFFRYGFCWNDISSEWIQSRVFSRLGVNDVQCMKLNTISNDLDARYLTAVLNSSITTNIIKIITNTIHTQINDIKMLPIVFPDPESHKKVSVAVTEICKTIENHEISVDKKKLLVGEQERQIDQIIVDLYVRAIKRKSAA
jgi:hypothetical protein